MNFILKWNIKIILIKNEGCFLFSLSWVAPLYQVDEKNWPSKFRHTGNWTQDHSIASPTCYHDWRNRFLSNETRSPVKTSRIDPPSQVGKDNRLSNFSHTGNWTQDRSMRVTTSLYEHWIHKSWECELVNSFWWKLEYFFPLIRPYHLVKSTIWWKMTINYNYYYYYDHIKRDFQKRQKHFELVTNFKRHIVYNEKSKLWVKFWRISHGGILGDFLHDHLHTIPSIKTPKPFL